MAREKDFQIIWVVVLAAAFWTAIWQHEKLIDLYHKSPVPGLFRHSSDHN